MRSYSSGTWQSHEGGGGGRARPWRSRDARVGRQKILPSLAASSHTRSRLVHNFHGRSQRQRRGRPFISASVSLCVVRVLSCTLVRPAFQLISAFELADILVQYCTRTDLDYDTVHTVLVRLAGLAGRIGIFFFAKLKYTNTKGIEPKGCTYFGSLSRSCVDCRLCGAHSMLWYTQSTDYTRTQSICGAKNGFFNFFFTHGEGVVYPRGFPRLFPADLSPPCAGGFLWYAGGVRDR